MTDKRIDAHTNTTTVADVDEFIVDSGSNGTRNITYSNLKSQILGSTSIATIGNSVTEAIYNTYTDIGDLTQTGVTGATVAAQISQLNDEIDAISEVKTISGHGSYDCGYTAYKYGKVVVLLVSSITNATTGQPMQLFTLPQGWRPKNFMRVIGSTHVGTLSGTYLVGFNIYSSGICETYSYTAFLNGLFSCAYMID